MTQVLLQIGLPVFDNLRHWRFGSVFVNHSMSQTPDYYRQYPISDAQPYTFYNKVVNNSDFPSSIGIYYFSIRISWKIITKFPRINLPMVAQTNTLIIYKNFRAECDNGRQAPLLLKSSLSVKRN